MMPVHQRPGVAESGAAMHEEFDLRDVWAIVSRRWPLIVATTALAIAAAGALTLRAAPVYQSSATVRIDEGNAAMPGLPEVFQQLSGRGEVSTEMEVLRSRSLAEHDVRVLGLQLHVTRPLRAPRRALVGDIAVAARVTPASYTLRRVAGDRFTLRQADSDSILATVAAGALVHAGGTTFRLQPGAAAYQDIRFEIRSLSAATDDLRLRLAITRPNREADVVSVRYRSTDAELARDVPNAHVSGFIARRVEVGKTQARSTVRFLRQQIDTIAAQLRGAEDELRRFREGEHIVDLVAEAGSQVQRFAELQAQRAQIQSEREALDRLIAEAQAERPAAVGAPSPYRKLLAFPTLFRSESNTSLLKALNDLEGERALLLSRRTPRDPDVQAISRSIADLESQLQAVVLTYVAGLAHQVSAADTMLASFGRRAAQVPAREVYYARLQRHTGVLSDIFTMLQTRLKEAEISQAVEDQSARVVDRAIQAEEPVSPRPLFNLAVATLLGLLLGTGAAVGREWLDSGIHGKEDVERMGGIAVLGMVPHIGDAVRRRMPRWRKPAALLAGPQPLSGQLIAARDSRNPIAEAYRTLRTNIAFARADRPPRTIVFTSPLPGDGKSTSVANLAATLAQQDARVLVIDGDLRRGTLHQVFSRGATIGLVDVLVGRVDAAAAIQQVDLGSSGKIDFMATGPLPPNPAELVGSERMRDLLQRLAPHYDHILIDSPPTNLVTDAALMTQNADGVVVIARAGKTRRAELAHAVNQLRHVRAPILGAVLNDVDIRRFGGSVYYSYYGQPGAAA